MKTPTCLVRTTYFVVYYFVYRKNLCAKVWLRTERCRFHKYNNVELPCDLINCIDELWAAFIFIFRSQLFMWTVCSIAHKLHNIKCAYVLYKARNSFAIHSRTQANYKICGTNFSWLHVKLFLKLSKNYVMYQRNSQVYVNGFLKRKKITKVSNTIGARRIRLYFNL